jgi:hypothetical protein
VTEALWCSGFGGKTTPGFGAHVNVCKQADVLKRRQKLMTISYAIWLGHNANTGISEKSDFAHEIPAGPAIVGPVAVNR